MVQNIPIHRKGRGFESLNAHPKLLIISVLHFIKVVHSVVRPFLFKIMCVTYILYSARIDTYYVGSTMDIIDRLKRHNSGRSTYTRRGIPWVIVYQKKYSTKAKAYQAELYIKSQKSRKYIEDLIEQLIQ